MCGPPKVSVSSVVQMVDVPLSETLISSDSTQLLTELLLPLCGVGNEKRWISPITDCHVKQMMVGSVQKLGHGKMVSTDTAILKPELGCDVLPVFAI